MYRIYRQIGKRRYNPPRGRQEEILILTVLGENI